MNMSSPALIDGAQDVLEQPGTWPWAFQSPTTRPSKCMSPFSASVSSARSPWTFSPRTEEKLAITACTPASVAGRAEADILREDGRADHVGVGVDGVDAPDQRNPLALPIGGVGGFPISVGELQPFGRRRFLVAARRAVAAGEDRSEFVAGDVG